MKHVHLLPLLAMMGAIPAATAGSLFSSDAKPCFVAGNAAYRLSADASATYTVRIDNAAPNPNLRMQVVDDAAAADFVLVDDTDQGDACTTSTAIKSVRLDPAESNPDLVVALSREPADHKIFVRSATFTEQDAAALFAAIWNGSRKAAQARQPGREFAAQRVD